MILFCEDCGEKNDLSPAALTGGRAVFRCCICGYPNDYSLKKTVDDTTSFQDIIRSFPDIVGAFLYDTEKGLLGAQMPDILTQSDIETLGAGLVCSYEKGVSSCPDIESMMVVISNKYFFVHRVNETLYSVIVATKSSLPGGLLNRIINHGKVN